MTLVLERKVKERVKNLFTSAPLSFVAKAFAGQGAILMYHRVLPEGEEPCSLNNALEVSRSAFAEQMEYISAKNTTSVPNLIASLKTGNLEKDSIAVTFDDGYRDNLSEALPILELFNIPATIYIAPALIDGTVSPWWYPEIAPNSGLFLSWDELRELSQHPLITIGAHSVTHVNLAQLSIDQLGKELQECREIIKEKLSIEALHLAYPYGRSEHAQGREFKAAADHGYLSAVTTRCGHIHRAHVENITALPRIPVHFTDSLDAFKRKLRGVDAIFASRGRRIVTE